MRALYGLRHPALAENQQSRQHRAVRCVPRNGIVVILLDSADVAEPGATGRREQGERVRLRRTLGPDDMSLEATGEGELPHGALVSASRT
ncbi:hypothetical protein [Mangrovactinospora gilvigrisea]|uniref:hypothetical protein n=1 Tax=Mangrovactinospora gilvigrisea TaxID=1428644 RepID=UPI001114F671|nr:hypothetical protein [Mangrovactinospora gilvigrisea]